MNGDNTVWNDDGTYTSSKVVYDGGIKLSDAGLGKTPPPTYLHERQEYTFKVEGLDLSTFETLGVRATSTSTAGGSIKWVDSGPEDVPVDTGHAGDLLWEENFDNYAIQQDHGSWGVVDLTSRGQMDGHAWAVSDGNGGWNAVTGEVVKGEAFPGSIDSTSGDFWLDTQNSPGGINIANWFHDDTGGKFQFSMDIGTHDFGTGNMQETNPNASLDLKIDGQVIHTFKFADFPVNDVMKHYDLVVDVGNGDVAGNHLIELVDTTPSTNDFVGFAVDTLQVHDWLV
jgi:hypothetical protein